METVTTQAAFLANGLNKMRLITMLSNKFALCGIRVQQAEADADRLIVSSSLSVAKESNGRPVVVIGTDTDCSVAPPCSHTQTLYRTPTACMS